MLQALNYKHSDWKQVKCSDPDTSVRILHGSQISTPHTCTECALTTPRIPVLHTPTVWSEAWSLSLSGFWFLSNVSSSTHRPTVNCYFLTVTKLSRNTGMSAHRIWWEGNLWCHSSSLMFNCLTLLLQGRQVLMHIISIPQYSIFYLFTYLFNFLVRLLPWQVDFSAIM